MNDNLKFNEHVCAEMILGPIEKRTGRVVQIRKGVGAFGSDLFIIRLRDGSLMSFENVMLRRVDDKSWEDAFYTNNGRTPPKIPEQTPDPRDSEGDEYSIKNEWPEVGFLIERPKQPESPVQTFAMTITHGAQN